MLFGEYDRETDIRVQCAEAREIALAEGISVGREQGMQQGSHARNIEIAKQMLQNNMSKSDIHMYTGLSLEEIEALQKS